MCKLGQQDSPVCGLVRLNAGQCQRSWRGLCAWQGCGRAQRGPGAVSVTQGRPLHWDSTQMSKYTWSWLWNKPVCPPAVGVLVQGKKPHTVCTAMTNRLGGRAHTSPGWLGSLQHVEWGMVSRYEARLAPVVNGEKQPWEFPDASAPVCTYTALMGPQGVC